MSGPIAEALPDFRPMPSGFVHESEWVAACFFANSSGFSKDVFYLEAFALPLFVPTEHLYFDYGFRVGGYDGVTGDVVKAVRKARVRLERIATLDGLEAAASNDLDVRSWELKMYSAILRNKVDRAEQLSERITSWRVEHAWEQDVIGRVGNLASLLRERGRTGAMDELAQHRIAVRRLLT